MAWLKRHVSEVWREKEEGQRGGGRSGGGVTKQGVRNEEDWSTDNDEDDEEEEDDDAEAVMGTGVAVSTHKGDKKTDTAAARKGAGKDKDAATATATAATANSSAAAASALPVHDVLNLSTVTLTNGSVSMLMACVSARAGTVIGTKGIVVKEIVRRSQAKVIANNYHQ